MPTAARNSAMPPKRLAISIGVRRLTSDSSIRCCIGFTREERQLRIQLAHLLANRRDHHARIAGRLRDDGHAAAGILGEREVVHPHRLLLGQAGDPDVADDADDGVERALRTRAGLELFRRVRLPHPPPDRALILPETLREPLVDDQHLRRAFVVRRSEEPSGLQRDRHRLEVAGRHRALERRDERFARRHRVALGQDDAVAVAAAEAEGSW